MQPYPLYFQPVLKQTIWGGRLLGERLKKPIGNEANYAESWEVVDHGNDQSCVLNGHFAGKTLSGLMTTHRNWLVGDLQESGFPLLLKYLDCNRVLSVQVHPSDEFAAKMDVPDRGKTEAWYILDAKPESLIYAGLKPGVDADDLRAAILTGDAEQALHSFSPKPGQCVFIPAGTVHALGAGLLVAEIQQASNTTFRLFDWNRVDNAGNARELHLEQGLQVTDFDSGPVAPQTCQQGATGWQVLVQCDKFVLRSLENGSESVGGDGRFHILTVPKGKVSMTIESATLSLSSGATLMLPASHGVASFEVEENSTLLEIHIH